VGFVMCALGGGGLFVCVRVNTETRWCWEGQVRWIEVKEDILSIW